MATDRYVTTGGAGTYAGSTSSGTPMSLTTAFANAVAGDRINVLAGTYTRSASDTPANAGTVTTPIIYRGYSSTIGDGYLGRTNGNGALILTNMPLISYNSGFRLVTNGAFTIWESIQFFGTMSGNVVTTAGDSVVKSCRFENASTNVAAVAVGTTSGRAIFFDCDILLSGASGGSTAITAGAASVRILYCRVKGGPAVGITLSNSALALGNVIFASTGFGIAQNAAGGAPTLIGNTIVGGSSDGINILTGTTGLQCIVNNLITDNTGDAIDMVSAANAGFLAYNRTRDNGSAVNSGTDWAAATTYAHVTTDTGGPETDYVDSSTQDYRLIAASPAVGVGWFPYQDIGALERVASAGGGGGGYTYGG